MLRKLCAILIVALMLMMFSISAFAYYGSNSYLRARTSGGEAGLKLSDLVKSEDIGETRQFLATITKPVGDETTFKKSYVVCGFSDKSDISIAVAVYDEGNDCYTYISEDSVWDISNSGIFSEEIPLREGANKLKIVAFVKSQSGNLKPGANAQVSYFTVTVLKESVKDRIMQGVLKVKESISSFFGN